MLNRVPGRKVPMGLGPTSLFGIQGVEPACGRQRFKCLFSNNFISALILSLESLPAGRQA